MEQKPQLKQLDIGGTTIEYWRAVSMYATSYSPCRLGIPGCSTATASGAKVAKGIVAVVYRWYVNMRGQQVYIPGYGFATIADTGGGIPGKAWIDLGYSDEDYEILGTMGHCIFPGTHSGQYSICAELAMTQGSAPLLPLNIPAILRQAELKPSRGLGQNFLSDDRILEKIVSLSEVTENDEVLEIGPGLGSLTRHLARSARTVTAVEIDKKIIPILSEILKDYANVNLVCGDILEQDTGILGLQTGYLVVANIPYYITSAVIRHLLEGNIKPARNRSNCAAGGCPANLCQTG